jgi:hypothetical protein
MTPPPLFSPPSSKHAHKCKGVMGEGMVCNLLKSGFNVVVWNRATAKSEAVASQFPGQVTIAKSAHEVCGSTSYLSFIYLSLSMNVLLILLRGALCSLLLSPSPIPPIWLCGLYVYKAMYIYICGSVCIC